MKKTVLSVLAGVAIGAVSGVAAMEKKAKRKVSKAWQMSDKHLALFLMMKQWVEVKQDGKNITEYFEGKGYKKIAIYGMSYAGETLVRELKNTGINVAYGIDKNANFIFTDIDIVSVDDELKAVDAVIVTAITFFDEIERTLSEKVDCPIISLEDVLYEV